MSGPHLPPIETVAKLSTIERASVLDALFEPSTALHTLSVEQLSLQTFDSYDSLISHIGQQLTDLSQSALASDTEWLDKILAAHPRLGEKKVESAQSRQEQAQLNKGGEEEAEKLRHLNDKYESTFPGLRFVVFVNGRGRPAILEEIQSRIERGDIQLERTDAIRAMCDIARDRATKLQQ